MKVKEVFDKIEKTFLEAGVDSPAFETSVLMEDLLELPRKPEMVVSEKELDFEQEEKIFAAAEKRISGYPLQYLIGNWEFFGRKFFVGEGVLIPRPETELLCETVLKYFSRSLPPKVVDLCSGSGCIAITIAKELSGAEVTAVELYDGAFEHLERNNAFHGNCVKTVKADALVPFGKFDCIVSNPPYIDENEMKELQTEVTFEPETALFGGRDGLDFYRFIVGEYKRFLSPVGVILLEIGYDQGKPIREIAERNGFSCEIKKDLGGNDRVAVIKRK